MGAESEKGDRKLLKREEAREQLAEAWLTFFWKSGQTSFDIETRIRAIREILERLSPADKEYFLHEEEGKDSELAKIREGAKVLVRTRKKTGPSAGEKLHIRRQKAAKRGTDPKKIH